MKGFSTLNFFLKKKQQQCLSAILLLIWQIIVSGPYETYMSYLFKQVFETYLDR